MTRGERGGGEDGLSLTEHVVLSLVVEGVAHGFGVARDLDREADLGRILTVRRPLVYRALERLAGLGLVETVAEEPGAGGPRRRIYRATRRGRRVDGRWLATPEEHVRDLRQGFLIKMRLLRRRGLDPTGLVLAQREALDATLQRLEEIGHEEDVVERWRRHNAHSVRAFLDDLAETSG